MLETMFTAKADKSKNDFKVLTVVYRVISD